MVIPTPTINALHSPFYSDEDIERVEKEYADLEEIWKAEKATVQGSAQIKSDLEQARMELEAAHRASDLTRMSELQYGVIPELEKQLQLLH